MFFLTLGASLAEFGQKWDNRGAFFNRFGLRFLGYPPRGGTPKSGRQICWRTPPDCPIFDHFPQEKPLTMKKNMKISFWHQESCSFGKKPQSKVFMGGTFSRKRHFFYVSGWKFSLQTHFFDVFSISGNPKKVKKSEKKSFVSKILTLESEKKSCFVKKYPP